jgi:hypothetical protein
MPDAMYRPGGLVMVREHVNIQKTLALGWPDGTSGPPVVNLLISTSGGIDIGS